MHYATKCGLHQLQRKDFDYCSRDKTRNLREISAEDQNKGYSLQDLNKTLFNPTYYDFI